MDLNPPNTNQSGLTMIELVVAMTVAGILLGLAVPGFLESMVGAKKDTVTYQLQGDVNLARSESIKSSSRFSVCARDPDNDRTCGDNWDNGWLVFEDTGPTVGQVDIDEDVIRVADDLPAFIQLNVRAKLVTGSSKPASVAFVRFSPRGKSNWRGGGTFAVCDSKNNDDTRDGAVALNIALNGSIRKARLRKDKLIDAFGKRVRCQ